MSPEKEKIKGELRELIGERFKTYNKSAERQIAETEETIATAQERLTGGGERSQPDISASYNASMRNSCNWSSRRLIPPGSGQEVGGKAVGVGVSRLGW